MTAGTVRVSAAALVVALGLFVIASFATSAGAAPGTVDLGTAGSFAVLAGSKVTNTGLSVIDGDVGVSPGSAVTGFPPGIVTGGTIHVTDAVAAGAQADALIAYNGIAGRECDTDLTGQDLGGLTLTAGIYCFSSSAQLTGTLTLDAQGDPDAVFIFQIGSTLTTASNSSVVLINEADACNVFFQVGSSATLGTATTFVGTILALTSITAVTGTTVEDGRLLALNGAVTLDTNVITSPTCATPPPTTTTTTTTIPTTTTTTAPTTTTTTAPTTTTTAPTTTTTTAPTTTTTTLPETTTTTTTLPGTTTLPATTTTLPGVTTTTAAATTTTARASSGNVTRGPTTPSMGTGGGGSTDTVTRTSTRLARTGSDLTPAAIVAFLSILVGSGMIFASRRTVLLLLDSREAAAGRARTWRHLRR